jgi:hypothetical protein
MGVGVIDCVAATDSRHSDASGVTPRALVLFRGCRKNCGL